MSKHNENREVDVLGIDLAKNSFQVRGVDEWVVRDFAYKQTFFNNRRKNSDWGVDK